MKKRDKPVRVVADCVLGAFAGANLAGAKRSVRASTWGRARGEACEADPRAIEVGAAARLGKVGVGDVRDRARAR